MPQLTEHLLGFLEPIFLVLIFVTIDTAFRITSLQIVRYGWQHLNASSLNNFHEVKIKLFAAITVGFLKQTSIFSDLNVHSASRRSLSGSFPLLPKKFVDLYMFF
jgi:hypothetical protein